MRYFLLGASLLAACNVSDAKPKASAGSAAAAAPDPWASKTSAPVVDPKDPDLAQLVELATSGPGGGQYPQADAVVAVDRDDITFAADRRVTRHHKSIVKLIDAQRGKEKFADVHIPYDTKRQDLTIEVARTVNADGVPHVAAGSEISDIVPPQLSDATVYSDVRERVISFPAVDKGSVIELVYTLVSRPGPDSALGGEQLLATWDPVLDRTVTITAPAGVKPALSVQGSDLAAVESNTSVGHTWTYHLANQPDRHPEMGQPSDAAVLPRVVYAFNPGWRQITTSLADHFLAAAVPTPLPTSVKAQADALVAGAADDTAKAQRLFAFVSHDIRTIEMPLGWAGYTPNAPDVVLAQRYADNRDKVALLLALCSAEGITGQPVFVRTGKVPVIASVPTVAQFDRILVTLTIKGSEVWLDPTDEHGQYDVAFPGQDNLALALVRGGSELAMRKALAPSTSVAHTSERLALAANGDLDANYTYALTGTYADRASAELQPKRGELLGQFFAEEAASLAASAVDKGHHVGDLLSVAGPLEITHHVFVPGYVVTQGNYRVIELPPISLSLASETPGVGTNERRSPLLVGTPRTEIEDVTFSVPAGWKVSYAPDKLEASVDGAKYSTKCETNAQVVTCHNELQLDQVLITPAQYPALQQAFAKLAGYERHIVVLVRG
jgi:hypothetical protein